MKTLRRRQAATAILFALSFPALLASCGDDGLERARERLERIEARVERAREAFQERRRARDEAERALEKARAELEEAEQQLAEARADIAEHADDALLFREVQGRLLEDRELEDVAISARVDERVVTLQGSVPSEVQRERAAEIAREVAGVERVVNQIAIDAAPAPE